MLNKHWLILNTFREYARVTEILKREVDGDNTENLTVSEEGVDNEERDVSMASEENLTNFYIKENKNREASLLDPINEVCLL